MARQALLPGWASSPNATPRLQRHLRGRRRERSSEGRGMIVEQLVPPLGAVELDSVFDGLRDGTGVAEPFADGTLAFFSEVSRRLASSPSTAGLPDVRALAFWMRRSHLASLKGQFEALMVPGTVRL